MSVPMELDDPATEVVPLDLTVKKEYGCAASAAVAERDGPEELTGDVPTSPQPPSDVQNGVGKSTPLDLSAGKALLSQPPPSTNVAQRATVVVLSSKVVAPPPPPQSPPPQSPPPKPQCKGYWTPDSSVSEHLAPLHGIYADAAAYRHMISSAAVPEYNPFLPVLPPSAASQLHHHNHFQHHQHQQHLHIQQQQQLHLQQQLQMHLQMQQQQQHHQEQQFQKQKLQLQAAYGGLPFDPALLLSGSPMYAATSSPSSSESNHFPFGGFDCSFSQPPYGFGYPYYERMLDGRVIGGCMDIGANRSDCPSPESTTTCTTTTDDHHHFNNLHHQQQQQQQQQRDLDRDHRHHIKACDMDDLDVVDPEEVAAIYRQSDFLSFRNRYMESLGPPRNFEKMRRSNNNNNDDHRLSSGQQQYDQTYFMKRQKNNEAAKRSRDAKRQKYIENQISVMYLTKKVSEMKDIKRRLLKSM